MFEKFGISLPHQFADCVDRFREKRFCRAEQAAVADRSTNDFAQDVAAAIIRWLHAVRHQKCRRAGMVGDDTKRSGAAFAFFHLFFASDIHPAKFRGALR